MPRIFALGLILPFAHPVRLILGALLPAGVIIWILVVPLSIELVSWEQFIASLHPAGSELPVPPDTGPVAVAAGLGCFLAVALWLCTWQRAAARGFAEPILRWLLGSLLRLPIYAIALAVWLLAPLLVILPALLGIGWMLQRLLPAEGYGANNILGIDLTAIAPVQLWTAGIGALAFCLLALWLSARLSPLPALVASHGWRRSLGTAWQVSSGHGFGLSLALLGCALLAFALGLGVWAALLVVQFPSGTYSNDTLTLQRSLQIGAIADLTTAVLVVLWQTSIAALLVRERGAGGGETDLAAFD
jgi:hypothetical protein